MEAIFLCLRRLVEGGPNESQQVNRIYPARIQKL